MAKAAVKKTPAKKPATKAKKKSVEKYSCEVCGLVVSVDEACGCAEACDLICCGTQMQKKRARA